MYSSKPETICLGPVNTMSQFQGNDVILHCEIGNLNNNHAVWTQGDLTISAGDIMVSRALGVTPSNTMI